MRFFVLGLGVLGLGRHLGGFDALLGELPVELPPLLLCPAELLYRRGEVQEVDRDDGRPGAEVGISDQGIEFPASLDESLVDL